MAINERSMQFLLADALRGYSQDFRLLGNTNPYRFQLNGKLYSAHASLAHFAARDNPDEWRIQVPRYVRDAQVERAAQGDRLLFIGFFEDYLAFTGWEPDYVLSLQAADVGSVYVPHSHAALAMASQVAVDVKRANNLGRMTAKITLRNELLGLYAENATAFHASRSKNELGRAIVGLEGFAEQPGAAGEEQIEAELGGERRVITSTRTAFARNPAFRDAVMHAYGHACCVCGRQLGLVQAAHIVPHSHPDCVDTVINGLALCIEHHKLYDDALLLPTAGRRLHVNDARVEHLRNIGQSSGLDGIASLAAKQYKVPDHAPSRPDDRFLEKGLRIRLGVDA